MADPFEQYVSYPEPVSSFPPDSFYPAPEPVSLPEPAPPPASPAAPAVDPYAVLGQDPSVYATPELPPAPDVPPKPKAPPGPLGVTVEAPAAPVVDEPPAAPPIASAPEWAPHWALGAEQSGQEAPWRPAPASEPAYPWEAPQEAPTQADYAQADKRAMGLGQEAFAKDNIRREYERAELGIEQKRQTYLQDDEARRQSMKVLEDAEAAGMEERNRLLSEAKNIGQVDRGRWLRNQSTGQRIAGFADAMIQGWLNPTGPNSGVDFILKEIDKDVDDQVRDIENKKWSIGEQRGLVADMLAAGRSMHQIRDTARVAALDHAERMITLNMQQYDQAGTRAAKNREVVMGIRAERARAAAAAAERARKEKIANIKFQMEVDEHNAKMRRGGLSPDEYAKEQERQRTQGVANTAGDRGQRLVWKGEKAADIGNASAKATSTVVGLIDEIDELRGDENATSDWVNSPDNQRQIQLGAELLLQLKEQYKLGAISGTDAELLENVRGFTSATQYRDFLPKLRQLRANIERSHGDVLRTYATNQDGSDYTGTFSVPTRAAKRETAAKGASGALVVMNTNPQPVANLQALERMAGFINENPTLLGAPEFQAGIDKAAKKILDSNDPQLIEHYNQKVKPALDTAVAGANEKNAPKKAKPVNYRKYKNPNLGAAGGYVE